MSDDFEMQLEQWLEGTLDLQAQDDLVAHLKQNPLHFQKFVEANIHEQMLRDAVGGERATKEARRMSETPAQSRRGARRRLAWTAATMAACLFLVFGVYLQQNRPESTWLPFASVALVQCAGFEKSPGDRLDRGSITLPEGLLRIVFDDGVEVTVKGPATFDLIAPGRTRLHSGLLTATVPPGSMGFQVDTPMAEVVDLGTAFGIEVDESGDADVSVFDGSVEVKPVLGSEKVLIREGEAVRVSKSRTLQALQWDASRFEKIWPASSGIAKSSGAFRFAPEWPKRMGLVQSDTDIFVLPEGYAKRLEQPLKVNISEPGVYRVESELTNRELPAGLRVKSFLLQFKPIDQSREVTGVPREHSTPSEIQRIVGEITFDRPILGLIVCGDELRATDSQFSQRGGSVPQKGRALELFGTPRDDLVSLSADRYTVRLDLAAFGVFSDHVRVIVDQSLPQMPATKSQ